MIKIFFCLLCFYSLSLEVFCQEFDSTERIEKKIILRKIDDIAVKDTNIGWVKDIKAPFCPSTSFKFIIKEPDSTNISLLDLNSNLISHLFEGYLLKGNYQISLMDSNLNSGVYLLVMNIGEEKYYRKIIILK